MEASLDQLPLWALQVDLAFAKNTLARATKRIEEGKPAYRRLADYERVLKGRIAEIQREIDRRESLSFSFPF